MEGLIPFVIHALKKSRERSKYRCLSTGSSGHRGMMADWSHEGSSHHRRTRSELPPRTIGSDFASSDPQLRPDPISSVSKSSSLARADPRKFRA
ncbi:hypothetical protein J5N97_010380 [Dioscorea zingiberensis]|uniref:Uncharacterized protein n=1 Tax=Dioscorea zingiberensis TaxID=325984 RepID=A0A9D5HMD4_9LILI|nr:hypothetical protein J5N97_010380 [Dioscorea zingiberensis]